MIAHPKEWHKIVKTTLGEAIDCTQCRAVCIAAGVTEYEEHLLPKSKAKHLSTFSRTRHAHSPVSQVEAHSIRIKAKNLNDDMDPIKYLEKQAALDRPSEELKQAIHDTMTANLQSPKV